MERSHIITPSIPTQTKAIHSFAALGGALPTRAPPIGTSIEVSVPPATVRLISLRLGL